jgi:hypothetical protein
MGGEIKSVGYFADGTGIGRIYEVKKNKEKWE